jgi:iron complex transport system substrate-binding protein
VVKPVRQTIYIVIGVTITLMSLAARAQVSVQDDRGQTITLAQPAKRIISLAPHLTEDLFAIGAGAKLVGVVSYSDYPAAALKIPVIGGYTGVDLEQIRALKPDLIVAWQTGNPPAQLAKIAALGIPMFYDNSRKLQDVPTVLERLGTLTATTASAQIAATQFRQRLATLQQQHRGKRPVRAFYQIWDRPLMTMNKDQIISDAMCICGAVNVFADLPALVPTIDDEAVLVKNPELILTSGEPNVSNSVLNRWKRWPRITAVQRNHLVVLPPDLLSRMGPRLVDGTEQLCAAVDRVRQTP